MKEVKIIYKHLTEEKDIIVFFTMKEYNSGLLYEGSRDYYIYSIEIVHPMFLLKDLLASNEEIAEYRFSKVINSLTNPMRQGTACFINIDPTWKPIEYND